MTLTAEQQKKVEQNIRLVQKVINDKVHGPYQLGIYTYDDIFQIGCIGLCKAAATDKGGTFSTYAYRLIWNEICDALIYATKRQSTELELLDGTGTGSASDPLMQILLRVEVHAGIQRARESANPSTQKGIDALLLMSAGYTCGEIGLRMHAAPNLVTAWMAKARKHLRRQSELQSALQLVNA